jgi:hypothetical protein
MSNELRAAELRIQDLVSQLSRSQDEAGRSRLECDDFRRVVAGLDAERDKLQVSE